MSLFKVCRGKAANLPSDMHDGYAYFTTDEGSFYIDVEVDGSLKRTLINPSYVESDTSDQWAKKIGLISKKNTIYVYTDHQAKDGQDIPGIKIGDGLAYVIDLPFVDQIYIDHIANTDIHITKEERAKWNKAITANIADNDENLVLSTVK